MPNKNNVKQLAENPHYTMSEKELAALEELLREEAASEKAQEQEATEKKPAKKVSKVIINKNRVKKDFVQFDKKPAIEEED